MKLYIVRLYFFAMFVECKGKKKKKSVDMGFKKKEKLNKINAENGWTRCRGDSGGGGFTGAGLG